MVIFKYHGLKSFDILEDGLYQNNEDIFFGDHIYDDLDTMG